MLILLKALPQKLDQIMFNICPVKLRADKIAHWQNKVGGVDERM